jgi:tRNA pseudouridine38-40 synthase
MKLLQRLGFVSYDGTTYHGFAKNKQITTIQSCIEKALCTICKQPSEDLSFTYSSRTDAGVHALSQPVCFLAPDYFSDFTLQTILNHHLPTSIQFRQMKTVPNDYNLRDSIEMKEYWYVVSEKDQGVVLSKYCWVVQDPISNTHLRQIANVFCGTHDFRNFAKDAKKYENTICTIYSISIVPTSEMDTEAASTADFPLRSLSDCYIISVIGNRFLHNQIRRMCGFMVHVATRKTKIDTLFSYASFEEMVTENMNATTAKAPARGLYLRNVLLSSREKDVANRESLKKTVM